MQTYQVGFDRVSAVRKAKNIYFLLSLFYFNIEWGVQNDIKREIQGFRGTKDYCERPHVDMQDNQSAQIPDQTNKQTQFDGIFLR